jgi:hypothetical protein
MSEISQIGWLNNCGNKPPRLSFSARQVGNWAAVKKAFSDGWLERTEDAQGYLTEYLSVRHPASYQGVWNKLVREARQTVEMAVNARATQVGLESGLGDELKNAIKWDVLNAVMEVSYRSLNPPDFFARLLEIYRNGHLPCGMGDDGAILFY